MSCYFEPDKRISRTNYLHFSAWVLVLLSSSCDQSEGKSSEDSRSDSNSTYEEPDVYIEGTLTDVDLEPGQAGVHFLYTLPGKDNKPIELTYITNKPFIYYDENALMCPPGWGLKVPIESSELAENAAVFLWFNDTNSSKLEMTVGKSEVHVVSVDIPEIENGGNVEQPITNPVTITETKGERTSGWWHGNIKVQVAFYSSDAPFSGESFQILAIAFNAIETEVPDTESPFCP